METVVDSWSGVTPGQLQDLFRQLKDGSLTGRHVQALLEHRDPFAIPKLGTAEDQLASWVEAYAKVGIAVDPSTVVIPSHKAGFDRLIVVPQGMTAQPAFELCGQVMPTWKYDEDVSLDELDTASPRTATNGAYAVWCRDTVEADANYKNKSYDKLISKGMNFLTLTERLLFSWKYFLETRKQLDVHSITLTSSLRSRGGVFHVRYGVGGLEVHYSHRDFDGVNLRAREAVSQA